MLEHPTARACVAASTLDTQPMCAQCAYKPWCGVEPVFHYEMQRSIAGRMPDSPWCQGHMGEFDIVMERLRERFRGHPLVGEIRGQGLLIGIELDADPASRKPFVEYPKVSSLLSKACFEERLLVRGGHDRAIASLAPPLIATKADADEIALRLGRAIDSVATKVKAAGLSD